MWLRIWRISDRSSRVKPWRVQNAASIAGLMITTEAMVAELTTRISLHSPDGESRKML
jgi:chaperonin GroEL (HSP60 family)